MGKAAGLASAKTRRHMFGVWEAQQGGSVVGPSEQEGAPETSCRSQRAGGSSLLNLVVSLSEKEPGQGFEHGC